MKFSDIFEAYYGQYRLEADQPLNTDDEYTIAVRLANEAINRWANYDNTYWRELFVNVSDNETQTVSDGVTAYDAPSDMQEVGGMVVIKDADGTIVRRYPIIEPHEAQFLTQSSYHAYFTGNPNAGFTMHLNPAPDTAIIGSTIDYIYYKQPTLMANDNSKPDMSNPYFMVHRMLASRFRGSRNPYYASAKTDAEDVLKMMKMQNDSGSWANPWQLQDNSGAQFGV